MHASEEDGRNTLCWIQNELWSAVPSLNSDRGDNFWILGPNSALCMNKLSFEACFHYIIWTMGLRKGDSTSHCSGEVQVQNSGLFSMKRDEPVEDDEAPPPVIESATYHEVGEFTLELGGHVPEPDESQ